MKKDLRKLLLGKQRPLQLILTLCGAFFGLLIFMGGIQVYQNIKELIVKKDLLGGDYLVISKRVQLLNTITGKAPGFSENEISKVKSLQGMEDAAGFEVGTFKTRIEMGEGLAQFAGAAFRSDLFLESVPDKFVDADREGWQWKAGNAEVPLIIPADYVKLYNNAFAKSQNLPLIPESIIKSVTFRLIITGRGKTWETTGRIAGFSERISSILVPWDFMKYANENYGVKSEGKPSRLILHSADPTSPKLAKELRSKGYELNEEKLRSSEINSILQLIIAIVSSVGILIIFLAILGFIQYNQLMAYRSAYEIQTLHWIGFSPASIAFPYIRFILISVGITFSIACISLFLLQMIWTNLLLEKGFEAQSPGYILALGGGFVISLLLAVIGCYSARRQVFQLSK